MLLPTLVMYGLVQVSHQTSNKYLHQKLLESWDGFSDAPSDDTDNGDDGDNAGEIVIDFYSELVKGQNEDENEVKDDNIIILPFFSDEEFTLRIASKSIFSFISFRQSYSVQNKQHIHWTELITLNLIYCSGLIYLCHGNQK